MALASVTTPGSAVPPYPAPSQPGLVTGVGQGAPTPSTAGPRDDPGAPPRPPAAAEAPPTPGLIGKLFRAAVKALTRRVGTMSPAGKRRRGETEGQFRRLARNLSRRFVDLRQIFRQRAEITRRYVAVPRELSEVEAADLPTSFEMMQLFENDADSGADFDDATEYNFDTGPYYGSLDL